MKPDVEQIWNWLDQVPDPEIPVISLVDLGIIRNVEWQGDTLAVTVSPTYSGCPATKVISEDIANALTEHGIRKHVQIPQLSPAWTTDWISEKGLDALKRYGIAPPSPSGVPNACPNCASQNVSRISQFGSTPRKAQWRCDSRQASDQWSHRRFAKRTGRNSRRVEIPRAR